MTIDTPRFKVRMPDGRAVAEAGQAVEYIQEALELITDENRGFNGRPRPGGAGWALAQLFGRLLELIIQRQEQVPDKNFLAFLNEAGIDLLAPRSAAAELTFTPAEDGPQFIQVPAGTQVATVQTEFAPEVVFETRRDLVVMPNRLVKCISFDPVGLRDCTQQALAAPPANPGQTSPPAFAVFKGDVERNRILYLGDAQLFGLADTVSRHHAAVMLDFTFDPPGDPVSDGWHLEWLYWNGATWQDITAAGAGVTDGTNGFRQNGTVTITQLPPMSAATIGDSESRWLGCRLTGGGSREHLPRVADIQGRRTIDIDSFEIAAVDAAFSAVQANTAFVPLDLSAEFQPLGPVPGRMDAFYIRADAVFSKSGVTVEIEMDHLTGTPTETESALLTALTLEWEISSASGWISLGTSRRSGSTPNEFSDTSGAFTNAAGDDAGRLYIQFEVPPATGRTAVNDLEGYWLRARLADGGYAVPSDFRLINAETLAYEFNPARNYAPFVRNLRLRYRNYHQVIDYRQVSSCRSLTDQDHRDHSAALTAGQTFDPFHSADEGPGLYLGFEKAFAAGQWIQLLLDVKEEQAGSQDRPPVLWQFYNGSGWQSLQIADGSRGLRERGYLGFFAPADHQAHPAFGRSAFWLRTRPAAPMADAGDDRTVEVDVAEATITLDASRARSLDPQRSIARYIWRHLESRPPTADPGGIQSVAIPPLAAEGRVTLDASASQAAPGRPIRRYYWRLISSETEAEELPPAVPYLNAIRINTVPGLNTVSLYHEILGAGNGQADQTFYLTRRPVYAGAQIAVREPDRPPPDELDTLTKDLKQAEPELDTPILPDDPTPQTGVWIRWRQVTDFYDSGPADRHFTLDPKTGVIRFGDGQNGKIPPVGRDNIKAVHYRVHDGAAGNTQAGSITALRNPSGVLADIKSVTNPEASAGGSDAETVADVKRRGPQRLKSRDRAVTLEDYEALAQEASGEVASARCLPARNPTGLRQEGWVTVVVMPKSEAARPAPGPALIRTVRQYLEARALTNLADVNQIYVKGPEYIEITVQARVVPRQPEKADEVELTVLDRLAQFLHPLNGGPQRQGWQLGRNVFQSEIYAEIEALAGVDHVARLSLQGSLLQYRIEFAAETDGHRRLAFEVPAQSQVSTFDERIKLVLAESIVATEDRAEGPTVALRQIDVYGVKVGDRLSVVSAGNRPVKSDLIIASLAERQIFFSQAFDPPANWGLRHALLSEDGRIRLPLAAEAPLLNDSGRIIGLTFYTFSAGDQLSIVTGGKRHPALEFIPVGGLSRTADRIFIPEGHQVYSGRHDIEMVLDA